MQNKKKHGRSRQPQASNHPVSGSRTRDLITFGVLWIPYLWIARRFWFVCDDAFITFQYSKNLALGNGVRFNPGDHVPVEGYSNFLWMVVGAAIEALKLSIELWPNLISFACGTVLLWVVYRTLRQRLDIDPNLAALVTLIVGLYPAFAIYSTSSLETMAFALLVFLTFERFVLNRNATHPWGAGLAALGLSLIRVEGFAWFIVIALLAVASRRMTGKKITRTFVTSLAIACGGFLAYWLWRYNYYGFLFPNTAYAKSGGSAFFLHRGFNYVAVLVLTTLTPLLTLPALRSIFRYRRLPIGLPIAAMAMGFYGYAIIVGGDFMAMGRLLIPGWPFAALLFAWMFTDIRRAIKSTTGEWLAYSAAAVTIIVGLLPAFNVHFVGEKTRRAFHFRLNAPASAYRSEYEQWTYQKENAKRWAVTGRALKRWADPGTTVVRGAIGALGYYSDLFYYDLHGLVIREVAMLGHQSGKLASPGHDRAVTPDFFLKYRPDILVPEVMSGLPGGDRGMSEEQSRGLFLNGLRQQWIEPLRRMQLNDRYIVDFRPLPSWEFGGSNQYLVYWRRITDDPTTEWEALRQRFERYESGEDPYRRVVDEGYPHPRRML